MTRFTIKLSDDEARALFSAAWATRREPREFIAYLTRRWLARRGYLLDPCTAGQSRAQQQSNTPARESLPTQRAEVQ